MAGSAWTNQVVATLVVATNGNFQGIFLYSPSPGTGNLIGSWSNSSGVDPFGNTYPAGLSVGNMTGPQVQIGVLPNSGGSGITFPTNTADSVGEQMASIYSLVMNPTLSNQQLALLIQSMATNAAGADPNGWNILMTAGADDNSAPSSMQIYDEFATPYLTFLNPGGTNPQMWIGQGANGVADFITSTLNGTFLAYGTSSGGTIVQSFTSNGTIVFPTGVTKARVQCQGSGAGGQWASGPGGGSGEYAEEPTLTVTAGLTYTCTVPTGGAGGTSSSGTGKSGATAIFSQGASNLVIAHGGNLNNTNPSTGGSGSTATIHQSGGGCNSASGAGDGGGGGGGAPTSTSAGFPGHHSSGSSAGGGGAGPGAFGGNGGQGGSNPAAGSAGASPGAGGGSGGASSSGGANGGKGGNAQIIVTYTAPGSTGILASFASQSGTDSDGNGFSAGFMGPITAVHPGTSPSVAEGWQYILNGTVGTVPMGVFATVATNFIRYKMLAETSMAVFNYNLSGTMATGISLGTLATAYRPAKQQLGMLAMAEPTAPTSAGPRTVINTNGTLSANWPNGTATSLGGVCLYPLD